jgi:hypothetical protein
MKRFSCACVGGLVPNGLEPYGLMARDLHHVRQWQQYLLPSLDAICGDTLILQWWQLVTGWYQFL